MPLTAKQKRLGYKFLAWARLLVALGILALFVRVYTSPLERWRELRIGLMDLQLSGALIRGGLLSGVALLWLVLAALFGRWFCSVACPMGTAQEVAQRLSALAARGKLKRFLSLKYVSPWPFRYVIFLGAACLSAALSFGMLDPIGNFGRIARNVFLFVTDGAASVLSNIGILLILGVIFFFAVSRGRRFCDWCPVGILLGLCSRAAPFGMKLRPDRCASCGKCERACPMNCVDSQSKTLNRERCVLCLSCAGVCAPGALDYGFVSWKKPEKKKLRAFWLDLGKYIALFAGVAYLAKTTLFRLGYRFKSFNDDSRDNPPPVPPGAGDVNHFTQRCNGCMACVSACPVGVILPSGHYPNLDYTRGYCQYNCVECGRVCPTGALKSLSREEKQRTRIALSEFIRPNCVVVTKRQSCGACAEVCPTHALSMVPLDGDPNLTVPGFDPEYCIGCGGCLNVCPAEPKAFNVRGVSVQTRTPGMRQAAPEAAGKDDAAFKAGEDFPF